MINAEITSITNRIKNALNPLGIYLFGLLCAG